jgi:hypothetical protein
MDNCATAIEAIKLSQTEKRTVRLAHTVALAADLWAKSDGDVVNGNDHEYWGRDWSVRLWLA